MTNIRKCARSILSLKDRDAVEGDIRNFIELLKLNPKIRLFLCAPIFKKDRLSVMHDICKALKVHEATATLLTSDLLSHIKDIEKIIADLNLIYRQESNINLVLVRSAFSLDQDTKKRIISVIGGQCIFDFAVDSSLVSGIVIKVNSCVYDYSVAGDILSTFYRGTS